MAADGGVESAPLVAWCVEVNRRPAELGVESPGNGEYGIAPGFDVETAPIHPP
jgi:hypothetical protein